SGTQLAAPRLPRLPASGAPAASLASHAARVGQELASFGSKLEDRVSGRADQEASMLEKARGLVGDLVAVTEDLPGLARDLNEEIRRVGEGAATAEQTARVMSERLVTRGSMEEEAAAREALSARLRALAAE